MADAEATTTARIGRPPKVDEHGVPTRERLLDAAVAACVEHGYEAATLSDIARRAAVSTPAVYSHFSGKAELMIVASKQMFERITVTHLERTGEASIVEAWLSPEAPNMRRLLLEVHRAAKRHPELRELLDDWLRSQADDLAERGVDPAQIKVLFLIMMGLLHLEDVEVLTADHDELVAATVAITTELARRPRT